MIVLIDNYDSFTFNLFHYLGGLGADVVVHRNDKITADRVLAMDPDAIVLSPGPRTPSDAGICLELIAKASATVPLLGVCLGHQAIASAYSAKIVAAPELLHGKTSMIHHDGAGLYRGLPTPFRAVRYHSLVADRDTLPDSLIVDAETADGTIMGVRHREIPLFGVQFHPESILTDVGKQLLQNFLDVVAASTGAPVPVATSIPAGR